VLGAGLLQTISSMSWQAIKVSTPHSRSLSLPPTDRPPGLVGFPRRVLGGARPEVFLRDRRDVAERLAVALSLVERGLRDHGPGHPAVAAFGAVCVEGGDALCAARQRVDVLVRGDPLGSVDQGMAEAEQHAAGRVVRKRRGVGNFPPPIRSRPEKVLRDPVALGARRGNGIPPERLLS
jgi:hypothetical protein